MFNQTLGPLLYKEGITDVTITATLQAHTMTSITPFPNEICREYDAVNMMQSN